MPELQEKDFINESYSKNPFPFWFWLLVVITATALIWTVSWWYSTRMEKEYQQDPFLEVTNREFSLFLWQFPERMRAHAPRKLGYLPGFHYENRVSLVLEEADNWVIAPPELLFLYHTWKRQISKEFSPRPIPKEEFVEFLNYAEEWKPSNWPKAPEGYVKFIEAFNTERESDLAKLPLSTLPFEVRQAFQGWKNYFQEGEAINALTPTYGQLNRFLLTHPHYARNYWSNILKDSVPDYLKYIRAQPPESDVPAQELANFTKVALFNFLQ